MSELIDISVGLQSQMPIWPGSSGFQLEQIMALDKGDGTNVSWLDMDIHTGTHIDAPTISL